MRRSSLAGPWWRHVLPWRPGKEKPFPGCTISGVHQNDAQKDRGDARPLQGSDAFTEEDGGEGDGDGAVERAKQADNGDLFDAHAEVAERKGSAVKEGHGIKLGACAF